MRFEFSHTHAYPGCKVRVPDASQGADTSTCVVEFSDGVGVPGRYAFQGDAIVLHIAPYETAKGTRIVAKAWLLQPDGAEGRWRVQKRLPQ